MMIQDDTEMSPETCASYVDNEEWVAQNRSHFEGLDTNGIFRVVTHIHPNSGCALSMQDMPSMSWCSKATLEQLAKFPDAVCVATVNEQKIHHMTDAELLDDSINETSICNMAYIATKSSSAEQRAIAEFTVKRWRELMAANSHNKFDSAIQRGQDCTVM